MITIIGNSNTYESKEIIREASKRSVKLNFIEWSEITLPFKINEKTLLLIRSPPPLTWKRMPTFLLTLIEEFERNEVKIIPSSKSLRFCDKFSQYSVLKKHKGINLPDSILTTSFESAEAFAREHGKIVSKPLIGGGGRGVKVFSSNSLKGLNSELESNGYVFLQRFIENMGFDIRTILIGGELAAQYARVNTSDFRYNLKQGGVAVEPSKLKIRGVNAIKFFEEALDSTVEIGEEIGLEMFGSDFILGVDGKLYFLELNPFFGFKGAKSNVASKLIDYLLKVKAKYCI